MFDDYCNHHIKANNELKKYGVPVNGLTQVHDSLADIHKKEYDSIKGNILINSEAKADLPKAVMLIKDLLSVLNAGHRRRKR